MKRKAISLFLVMLALTACGQSQPSSPESSQPTNIEIPASPEASSPEASSQEASSQEESSSKESSVESSDSTIDNETGNDTGESVASGAEDGPAATAKPAGVSDEAKIWNNGNHFVQIGDRIYFRIPSAESMNTGAVFASFLDSVPGSSLMAYDLTTGELTEITSDNGYGKLYVTNETMLVTSSMDDETKTYTILEGIKLKNLSVNEYEGDGYLGIDSTGTYVVVSNYDYNERHNRYTILKNGVKHADISSPDLYNYVGFCDGTLLYITLAADGSCRLCSYNLESGETIVLGDIPIPEYESFPGVPEQLVVQGSSFYLSVANYEGTGHFYAGSVLLTGDVHTPDSLVENHLEETGEEFPNHAPRFTVNLGTVTQAAGIPGTAEVNNDSGEIGYYDENGSWNTVLRGYASQYSGDYETGTDVELAEYVNGRLFVVRNDLLHTPEEDIGWRTAYRRTHTTIEMINTLDGRVTILAEIDNP